MVYASADTGVDWDHPALIGQYRGWDGTLANHNYSWWDAIHQDLSGDGSNPCGFSSPVPCDDENHGTHVMGIGVGDDGAGNQIGMAPGARWIACRNMDEGVGRPSTYIECLQFFMAPWDLNGQNPDPTRHADVISNSYSCPTSEGCIDPGVLHEVVNNVRAAGIFMAVSAGNDGPGCGTVNTPPALEDDVTTVGAVSSSDAIAPFSSWGPVMVDGSGLRKPDLVAPGVGVRSSIPVGKIYGADYSAMSGTSMAAPHVAGAVALLWSAIPALRGEVAATEQLLESSAQPLYPSAGQLCGTDTLQSSPNNVYGFGLLNVLAAYRDTFHYSYYFPLIYEGNY
ncbi:MAG: S8 family serine peptidase [Chloroflexi bacterium]|nr:S8 family serine peptidase [Chloroflexota bacterium]